MTQPGETDNFNASEHIKILLKHSHARIFDYCVLNNGEISKEILMRYEQDGSRRVVNDTRNIINMGYRVIEDDVIISEDVVRHDPAKLAKIILGFIDEF